MVLYLILFFLAFLVAPTTSTPIEQRSTSRDLTQVIDLFLLQTRSALYVATQISLANSTISCSNNSTMLPDDDNNNGSSSRLDPSLTHLLLCQAAIGIEIFPNLTQAKTEMAFAIEKLEAIKNKIAFSECGGRRRFETLGQAGIDEASITALICGPAIVLPSPEPMGGEIDEGSASSAQGVSLMSMSMAYSELPIGTTRLESTSSGNSSSGIGGLRSSTRTSLTTWSKVELAMATVTSTRSVTLSDVPLMFGDGTEMPTRSMSRRTTMSTTREAISTRTSFSSSAMRRPTSTSVVFETVFVTVS